MLQRCGKAKEMGSMGPVTIREERDNIVLSRQEALAAIKRRTTHLNVKIQDPNQDFLEVRIKEMFQIHHLLQRQAYV